MTLGKKKRKKAPSNAQDACDETSIHTHTHTHTHVSSHALCVCNNALLFIYFV